MTAAMFARSTQWLFFASVLPCLVFSVENFAENRYHNEDGPRNPTTGRTVNVTDGRHVGYPKKWLAGLFYETLADFTVSPDVGSSACQRQTQMYIRHLANDSMWAVQMSDSWSRYPNGILVGTTHQMGVYEECVEVHWPVQGKYCMPQVTLKSAVGEDFIVGKQVLHQSYGHAWQEILGFVDLDNRIHRNKVRFGICIPDSCTAQDLEISLQKEFDKNFLPHQVKAQIRVESILCSTDKDTYPYDTGFYLTSSLIGLTFLICCLSTAYHLINIIRSGNGKKTKKIPEIFRSFSMISNGRNLIKYDRNNNLNTFNGLKVVVMIFVFFGHKFFYFAVSPITYGKSLEKIYSDGPYIILTSMNLVDPFFYITGYLTYVLMLPQFTKSGTNCLQIPLVIVYKYLRVLPAYLVMMIMTAFIIPHLGDGPLWASKIWPEAEKCKNYWWANILAVSNFIEVENQCLIAGWYISCLLQFLVIGTVVMYVYAKNRKIGICLIVFLLVASLIIPFVLTYVHQAYGFVRLMYSFLESPSNSVEFAKYYRPFYMRGIPFYAGILAPIITEELKKREIKFSPLVTYLGVVIISFICMWIQLTGSIFYDVHRPYNVLEQSLYATLSHCTWTIMFFWFTLCQFTSDFGPIEKVFNNRFIVPMGRLTYSVYLVNLTVMLMMESRQRVAVLPTSESVIDGWISGTVRTYIAGILLHMIIEAPYGLFIKQLVYGKKQRNNNNESTLPNRTVVINTQTADSTHL